MIWSFILHGGRTSFNQSAAKINFTDGVLGASLHALNMPEVLGVVGALLLGGMVKGIVSIGVPLVAMPILSQFLPIKQAVLLLSMPIIYRHPACAAASRQTATRRIPDPGVALCACRCVSNDLEITRAIGHVFQRLLQKNLSRRVDFNELPSSSLWRHAACLHI